MTFKLLFSKEKAVKTVLKNKIKTIVITYESYYL